MMYSNGLFCKFCFLARLAHDGRQNRLHFLTFQVLTTLLSPMKIGVENFPFCCNVFL
jgi:hypothetical protein